MLVVCAPTGAAGDERKASRKIDRALRESLSKRSRTQDVIVTLVPGCEAYMGDALRQHGDVVRAEHPIISAVSVKAHTEDIEELAVSPCVKAIAADVDVYAADDDDSDNERSNRSSRSRSRSRSRENSRSSQPSNTLREAVGLRAVASRSDDDDDERRGVGVVIIDSGITPTSEFSGRIRAFYDFTRGGVASYHFDDYGHGTHVAGLIAGSGRLSNYEFQGMAPEADLIVMKVLDRNGRGRTSDVIRALEFTIANRVALGAKVINLSLGHPIYAPAQDDPLVQAVERASASGLIVVASAGNAGRRSNSGSGGVSGSNRGDAAYTGITSPGNAPSAITVGATRHNGTVSLDDDQVASFSSRGPTWFDAHAKPDVVAPGEGLLSGTNTSSYLYESLLGNRGKSKNGYDMLRLSGSSMSAGVTTGIVALMLEEHRSNGNRRQKPLTPNLVKAMLQFSAVPLPGADVFSQGAGAVNATGALALAGAIDTSTALGLMWLDHHVTPSSHIGGRHHAWSQRVIWGDEVLTGVLVYYNLPQWTVGASYEDNIIWGTDDSLDNIIWGTHALVEFDNIIWGTTHLWAANLAWRDRVIGLNDGDNIIWGTDDNIIWGTLDFDNIIWGTWDGDNIIWGTWDGDNIIWGTDDNIIWGTFFDGLDNIIWGTFDLDNIIWGTGGPN
jgi:serine protease AprX